MYDTGFNLIVVLRSICNNELLTNTVYNLQSMTMRRQAINSRGGGGSATILLF